MFSQILQLGCIHLKNKELFLCPFEEMYIKLQWGRITWIQASVFIFLPTFVYTVTKSNHCTLFSVWLRRWQNTKFNFGLTHGKKVGNICSESTRLIVGIKIKHRGNINQGMIVNVSSPSCQEDLNYWVSGLCNGIRKVCHCQMHQILDIHVLKQYDTLITQWALDFSTKLRNSEVKFESGISYFQVQLSRLEITFQRETFSFSFLDDDTALFSGSMTVKNLG